MTLTPEHKQQQAQELFKQNRLAEAKAIYTELSNEHPFDAQNWHMLSAINGMLGRMDEAETCCRTVIRLQPAAHGAHVNLGNVLAAKGQHEEAESSFQLALGINPGDAQACVSLGNLMKQQHRTDEARQYYDRALADNPNTVEAINSLGIMELEASNTAAAIELFDRAIGIAPEYVDALVNKGQALLQGGNPEVALQFFEQACRIKPDVAAIYLNLGTAWQALGNMENATQNYQHAAALAPATPDISLTLASALHSQHDYAASAEECRRLLAMAPSHMNGQLLLASNLKFIGQHEQALTVCKQAADSNPQAPGPMAMLGNLYTASGRMEDAEAIFRNSLELDPDNLKTMADLAMVYRDTRGRESAIALLKRALDIDPDFTLAHSHLGNIYQDAALYQKAVAYYQKARALDSTDPKLCVNLGFINTALGNYEAALEFFRKAQQLDPNDQDAIAGEADLLHRTGDSQAARDKVRPLLQHVAVNPNVALAFAVFCDTTETRTEAAVILKKLLDSGESNRFGRISFHFALGKLLDKNQQYADAFRHYNKANLLKAPIYDATVFARSIDELIAVFPENALDTHAQSSETSELPVFIVGMPRSGTSLVEQMLSSVDGVYGAGELERIHKLAASLASQSGSRSVYPRCMKDIRAEILDRTAGEYIRELQALSPDAVRIIDKMPANFLHLGLIERLFPKARIIHCRRNPLDTCLSCYFQNFSIMHEFSCNLYNLGNHYQQYRRLMAHWKRVLRIPIFEIQYEDLVDDFENRSRAIIDFCGLQWDDSCLDFHKTRRTVKTASYDQVRRPLYATSVERWKHYEEFLGPLIESLGDTL